MLHIQERYAKYLPLEGAKVKSTHGRYFMNFRCHLCGDSKKSASLKRGWFERNDANLVYHCYNCGKWIPFVTYLKTYFPEYYIDYIKEVYSFSGNIYQEEKPHVNEDIFSSSIDSLDLQRIIEFPKSHAAYVYLKNRKIPERLYSDIYYCDNFYEWAQEKDPGNFNSENHFKHDQRVLFPLRDFNKKIFGVSARSIKGKTPKYITIKFDENEDKIFGLDRINLDDNVFVLEGPIDSFFIKNSIAMVGSTSGLEKLFSLIPKEKLIIVPDNEKRNKFTTNYMKKALNLDLKVVIWPQSFKFKDINEAIVAGIPSEEINKFINNNAVYGIIGLTRLKLFSRS